MLRHARPTAHVQRLATDVTFRVDVSTYEAGYGTVNLNGSFNGWCGGCTEMTDNDGDMVYGDVALAEGTFEYKFTLDGWTARRIRRF